MSAPVYVVLLHHPVTNRQGELVTSSVTNMDIHDISRTARTYGAKGFFLVTPLRGQHEIVNRILGHWATEQSRRYHPDRVEALRLAQLVFDFDEVKAKIKELEGEEPEVVLTDARPMDGTTPYEEYKRDLGSAERKRPVAVVFGTGWGVAQEFYSEVHRILPPIYGPGREKGYNHLSVRSAVAVILDRLLGE